MSTSNSSMSLVIGSAAVVVSCLYLVRRYRESKWGRCETKRMMDGKIVIVTGANSGLGKKITEELARRKATVVMACRDVTRAKEAAEDIKKITKNGELVVMELDLGNLFSIRSFAAALADKFDQVDVLINNAGVYFPKEGARKTSDGFEIHMGVNHLGHFLLTNLLIDQLEKATSSRVVVVSSSLYKSGQLDFDNLDGSDNLNTQGKGRNPAYASSKLANVLFTVELDRRVKSRGISANVLCPGWVYTGLFRHSKFKLYQKILFFPVAFLFMRNTHQGIQTILHCSVCERCSNKSGGIYADCRQQKFHSNVDDISAKKLWDLSEKMVGLVS